MTAQEIRDICINSAQTYYDYLAENGKGIQEVEVFDIDYPPSKDLLLKLRLSAKLFDTEAIFFKLRSNGQTYDTGCVKVLEYDSDKNILLIKPEEAEKSTFTSLRARDILVISDLKFLVERIRLWYERNGANVNLPTSISTLQPTFQEILYLKGLSPSLNQKNSLESIFHQPFTYVWGAPGTGKTQFVLAYALLHYIRRGKKIAILAPTNNAIEQVLRGVLKMVDTAGIERSKLIRLGTPSKKFAEEYPEVCEEKGVQKKLDEIDKRIAFLERMVGYEIKLKALNESEQHINGIQHLEQWQEPLRKAKEELVNHNRNIKAKEIDKQHTEQAQMNLDVELKSVERRLHSLSHKVKKWFTSAPSKQEQELERLQHKREKLRKEAELLQYDLSQLQALIPRLQKDVVNIEDTIRTKIAQVQQALQTLPNLAAIVASLSINNHAEIALSLETRIQEEKDRIEIDGHLASEYRHYSLEQMQLFLAKEREMRERLAISSTEERLLTVNVVACTLDGYVGRYTETKLKVDHIFLDEAGYANIIKALTLFNTGVPITFLGDHKQLPPVCEINDFEIERDERYQNMFLWAQSSIYLENLFHCSAREVRQQYLTNETFVARTIQRTVLNSTFRFGANLAKVLGRHVYDAQFTSSNEGGETQILYTHAQKQEGNKSRVSINEVTAIKNIVADLGHEDYVILTPYTKQVRLLGQHLPHDRNNLRILTVHGSQGREWKTVIFSVVDTHDKWFVDSTLPISKGLNLVNTAVSRAKEQLIIVCDNNYWQGQRGQLISDLMSEGRQLKINLYQ